jgi:hypothetical protein
MLLLLLLLLPLLLLLLLLLVSGVSLGLAHRHRGERIVLGRCVLSSAEVER